MGESEDNTSGGCTEEWNITDYCDPVQPPNQWALKKAFMEAYKSRYPKDRLLALANTFSNIEFLGSRYPTELEKLIALLSNDVPEIKDYRNGRRNALKRTFVSASDATRAKQRKTGSDIPKSTSNSSAFVKAGETESATSFTRTKSGTSNDIRKTGGNLPKSSSYSSAFVKAGETESASSFTETKNNSTSANIKNLTLSKLSQSHSTLIDKVRNQRGIRSKIIVFMNSNETSAYSIVNQAASRAKLDIKLQTTGATSNGKREFMIKIGNEIVAKDFAEGEKKAKELLGPKALQFLQETCFTVLVKTHLEGQNVNKNETKETEKKEEESYALPEGNIGAKMMRMMGWTGEGLGRNEDGIKKPVEVNRNVSRMGLIHDTNKDFKTIKNVIFKLLEDYAKEVDTCNLVFSNDYSSDERKIIHGMAQKLDLKSKSYGKNENRQLVVSKKMDPWTLVAQLLSSGGENVNYKITLPAEIK